MKIHYNINSFSAKNPVFTIGSFDGVHKGHKKVLSELISIANKTGGESVVMIFWPHPREILSPLGKNFKLIQTIDERIEKLAQTGIDHLIVFPFNLEFSKYTASLFIEKILANKLNIKYFLVGFNQRFGSDRISNISEINKCAYNWGIKAYKLTGISPKEAQISSTQIRDFLFDGKIKEANNSLGFKYKIEGKVVEGKQIGRTLGFPTANIEVLESYKIIPQDGVYAVEGKIGNNFYQGMLNIGIRPTLNGKNKTIEVHWFNFDDSLYGKKIKIYFTKKIRNELKFNNIDELKEQLKEDKKSVLKIHNKSFNILIAPDSFKGSISAINATKAIKKGISTTEKKLKTKLFPLADGGEGSIDILKHHLPHLEKIKIKVKDALMHDINSYYYADLNNDIAFLELAKVNGLAMLPPSEQNPLLTTSYGFGQMVLNAQKKMFKTIVLFLGGSSTNDAGLGVLHALGAKIQGNFEGNIPTGIDLINVTNIEFPDSSKFNLIIASDVNNWFCGTNGAVDTYAKQKGATEIKDIQRLEKGMENIRKIVRKKMKIDLNSISGTGAAGGIAGTLHVFLQAKITQGADFIFKTIQLEQNLKDIDLIITGEGSIDYQTKNSKLIWQLKKVADKTNIPIWAISGYSKQSNKIKTALNLWKVSCLSETESEKQKAILSPEKTLSEKTSSEISTILHTIVV